MIILAIDTSGPVAGVSVWCDGAIRYEAAAVNKMTHSENIMPMVEEALLRAGVTKEQLTLLRSILTAKGRSYSDPIYGEDGKIDMDASRRVEFKFRLKDSEMIDEMRNILKEYEAAEGGAQ